MPTDELGEDKSRMRHSAASFWRYWTGSTISLTGDAITAVALPLTAIDLLKASSFEVSWLTAATYSAWLLIGLPAGAIVHRLPMRGVQVAMDLFRALALASIPFAAWAGVLTVFQLVAVALAVGFATVVFDVGNSTLLPFIVSEDELTTRNSLMDASVAVTQTGGTSVGGVLVQFLTAPGAIISDVASYVMSAFLLSTLPRPRPAQQGQDRIPTLTLMKNGCVYVVKHPVIGPCTLYQTIGNVVAGGLLALTPVFLVRSLGAPTWLVGILIASEGAGGVLGAALASRLAQKMGTARAVMAAAVAAAVLALLMPSATGGWWRFVMFGIGNAGLAAGAVVGNVLTRTYRQTAVPRDLFPQVMATVRFITWGVIPLAALASGAIASALGNRTAFWVICLTSLGGPLSLLLSGVLSYRDFADVTP